MQYNALQCMHNAIQCNAIQNNAMQNFYWSPQWNFQSQFTMNKEDHYTRSADWVKTVTDSLLANVVVPWFAICKRSSLAAILKAENRPYTRLILSTDSKVRACLSGERLTLLPWLPWWANFSYVSLKNTAKCLQEKHWQSYTGKVWTGR